MIEKAFIVTCDWCGDEKIFRLTRQKNEVLKKYADGLLLYEFIHTSQIADELFFRKHDIVYKNLMFCCEECAEKWFEENPDCRGHYKLVKSKQQ